MLYHLFFKSQRLVLWISFLCVFASESARAFGDEGHTLACRIAWQSLQPETQIWLKRILHSRRRSTFEEACTWADGPGKAHAAYAWLWPRHYMGVPLDADQIVPEQHCARSGCVTEALLRFHQILQNPEAQAGDRQLALKMLVHLIADIHLPVHIAHADGRGGTRTKVLVHPAEVSSLTSNLSERSAFLYDPQDVLSSMLWNEHMLWDSGYLVAWISDEEKLNAFLREIPIRYSAEPMNAEQVLSWADESFRLAQRRELFAGNAQAALHAVQVQEATKAVLVRVREAGERIAQTLNALAHANASTDESLPTNTRE